MDITIKEITIAALLHDVGKFAQRADRKEFYDRNLEGQFGYKHAVFTNVFLEKYIDVLPDDVLVKDVIRIAANHHKPSSYDEWLIAQGDRLSSGSDRCALLGDTAYIDDPAKFYEKPLVHILSSIQIPEKANPSIAYCQMKALDEDAILSTTNSKIGKSDYNALWEKFEKDFEALKGLLYKDFVNSLDSLLERYWWCIPSATNSDSDISLYQHAKTTAAFASALYEFHKQAGTEDEHSLKDNSIMKFRFLKGDVSGIQRYIFDLKSHNDSTKLLRARSFEIAALGDILAKNIVGEFGLSGANIVTSAGGNFMLLLPNTEKTKDILPQIQLEIELYFLKEFAGKLSVIISDGVEASQNDVQKENMKQLLNKIGFNADCCKQKKMQKALQKNGAILSDFYEQLRKNGECVQCGVFPALKEGGKCKNCEDLAEIGGKLMKASFISYKSEKLKTFSDMIHIEKKDFGKNSASVNDFIAGRSILHLPYTAPQNQYGELLSFADIAEKSNNKIAMFKADIDNLGLVFSSSLGERASFSRYADMSHKLHYFFSAYYTHFVKTHGFEDVIYTVFSGGDDLCVLGSWNAVMQFASDFQAEIGKLSNNNPSLTLSGGIVLSSASTPVRLIAESAEEELEKSKHRTENNHTAKNAITVFGTTVSWDKYRECLENGKKLQGYLEDKMLSKAIVYKMIDFARRAENIKKGDISELLNLRNRTWKSNFRYIVVRNVKDDEAKNWLLGFGSSIEEIISFRIAVCYALYTQRG